MERGEYSVLSSTSSRMQGHLSPAAVQPAGACQPVSRALHQVCMLPPLPGILVCMHQPHDPRPPLYLSHLLRWARPAPTWTPPCSRPPSTPRSSCWRRASCWRATTSLMAASSPRCVTHARVDGLAWPHLHRHTCMTCVGAACAIALLRLAVLPELPGPLGASCISNPSCCIPIPTAAACACAAPPAGAGDGVCRQLRCERGPARPCC